MGSKCYVLSLKRRQDLAGQRKGPVTYAELLAEASRHLQGAGHVAKRSRHSPGFQWIIEWILKHQQNNNYEWIKINAIGCNRHNSASISLVFLSCIVFPFYLSALVLFHRSFTFTIHEVRPGPLLEKHVHVKSFSFAARYCPRVSAALCHSTIWSSNSHLPLLRCYLRLAAWKHWFECRRDGIGIQKRQSDIVWVESVAIAWYCMRLYVSVQFRVVKKSLSLSLSLSKGTRKKRSNKTSSTNKCRVRISSK